MQHQLDHERLDVYQLELQFVAWATDLIVELSALPEAKKRRMGEVLNHLDRACLSWLFNTSEGNGRRPMRMRAKFFDDARGSAPECACCLDALVAKQACSGERIEQGKSLIVRIVSMLTKLVDRFSPPTHVREESARYLIEDEDEMDSYNEHPSPAPGWQRACSADSRGSILLLTVVLLALLSVLFLLVANSVLLGTRARESLQASSEMFYIAEAGLYHGQAYCVAYGENSSLLTPAIEEEGEVNESEIEAPFGAWLSFGRGEYRIKAYRLSTDAQPFVERDSGVLLVATARLDGDGRKRVCLLLDEPPSCRALAWWEPE